MIRCHSCSREVQEDSRFCPSCGVAIETSGFRCLPDPTRSLERVLVTRVASSSEHARLDFLAPPGSAYRIDRRRSAIRRPPVAAGGL